MDVKKRRASLLKRAKEDAGCDVLIAFAPENVFYMTGFWGEGASILQKGKAPTIVAPELEASRARSESDGCSVVIAERGMRGVASGAARLARKALAPAAGQAAAKEDRQAGACTDCSDYDTMTYLKRAVPGIVRTTAPFYNARMLKDAAEIRILGRASRIIDCLFEICSQRLCAGMRESEMQAILMAKAAGLDAFDTGYPSTLNPLIIAGGPNGALPHAQVSGRRIRKGDLVVADLTLRHAGYVSDATRTFAVGSPGADERDVYDIVRESQRLGLWRARAGATCGEVDEACRLRIKERGHGAHFIHSTGHGVGLEVHEPPAVSHGILTRLREGMAITVEPGIYIPGRFGVRIEDTVVVRGSGRPPDVLHKFTKDMITV